MRYPVCMQTETNNCGVACLFMIIKYYHGFIPIEYIEQEVEVTNKGVSLYDLKCALELFHVSAKCYKVSKYFLGTKRNTPFIAHVEKNGVYHYILVYKIEKKYLLIVDPAKGVLEKIKKEDFIKIFTSYILLTYPSKALKMDKQYTVKTFFRQVENKKDEKHFVFKFFLSILLELLTTSTLYLIVNVKNAHLLIFFIVLFLYFLKNFLLYSISKQTIKIEQNLEERLRYTVWESLFFSPFSLFFGKEKSHLVFLRQTEELANFYIQRKLLFYFHLPILLFFLLLEVIVLKTYFLFFIIFILEYFFYKKLKRKKQKETLLYQHHIMSNKEIEDSYLASSFDLKNASLEIEGVESLERHMKMRKSINQRFYSHLNKEHFFSQLTNDIFMIIGLFILVDKILGNPMLSSSILVFFYIHSFIIENMKLLFDYLLEKEKIKVMIENMIETKEEKKSKVSLQTLTLKHLRLPYGNVKNAMIHIKKGDIILFLGDSGVGKTSVMYALMGKIKANRYVNGCKNDKVLERLLYLPSNPHFIVGSAFDNITFFKSVKKEEVDKVCDICNIDASMLEKDVSYLSSGEKQKINLARILLRESDALILDESLSQLEEKEEVEIIKKVIDTYPKIYLFISHKKNLISVVKKVGYFTKEGQIKYEKGGYYGKSVT